MGRHIDQIEDPALKRALENPAKPDRPKGLGHRRDPRRGAAEAAEEHYVTLLKGKDPAITEPRWASPSSPRCAGVPGLWRPGRSGVFESELAEIGRATTKAEAVRRAGGVPPAHPRAGRGADRRGLGRDERLAVEGEAPPRRRPGADRRDGVLRQVTRRRKGIPLPPEATREAGACRLFLNTHAGPRTAPWRGTDRSGGRRRDPTAERRPRCLPLPPRSRGRSAWRALPPEIETDFNAAAPSSTPMPAARRRHPPPARRRPRRPPRKRLARRSPAAPQPASPARAPRAVALRRLRRVPANNRPRARTRRLDRRSERLYTRRSTPLPHAAGGPG